MQGDIITTNAGRLRSGQPRVWRAATCSQSNHHQQGEPAHSPKEDQEVGISDGDASIQVDSDC